MTDVTQLREEITYKISITRSETFKTYEEYLAWKEGLEWVLSFFDG